MCRKRKGTKKWSSVTEITEKSASTDAVRRNGYGGLESRRELFEETVVISRRNGGARMTRPSSPRMQPSSGVFFGRGGLGPVPRICDVQELMASKVAGAKRMLT